VEAAQGGELSCVPALRAEFVATVPLEHAAGFYLGAEHRLHHVLGLERGPRWSASLGGELVEGQSPRSVHGRQFLSWQRVCLYKPALGYSLIEQGPDPATAPLKNGVTLVPERRITDSGYITKRWGRRE
jgi:hypothetical protein